MSRHILKLLLAAVAVTGTLVVVSPVSVASTHSPNDINVAFPIKWLNESASNHGATFLESNGSQLNNCGGPIATASMSCNFLFSYTIDGSGTPADSVLTSSAYSTWDTITSANIDSSLCNGAPGTIGQVSPLTLNNCFNSNSYGEWIKPTSSGVINLTVPLACQNVASTTISGMYMNLYQVTVGAQVNATSVSQNGTTVTVTTSGSHLLQVGDYVRPNLSGTDTSSAPYTISGNVRVVSVPSANTFTFTTATSRTVIANGTGVITSEDKIASTPVGSQEIPFSNCSRSWSAHTFTPSDFQNYTFDFGGSKSVSTSNYYTFLISGANVPGTQPSGAAGVSVTPTISTSTTSITGIQGTPITASAAITPSNFTGTPTYSISPSLSGTGLTFNPTTGVISGTPTSAISLATYTITGTSGSQSATTTLTINVAANTTPSITPATQTISVDTATAINSTAFTQHNFTDGNGHETFTVSPSLPAGLNLNAATGVITGTPSSVQSAITYTITAQGQTTTSESATATISITVTAPAAPAPSTPSPAAPPTVVIYTTSLKSLVQGTPFTQTLSAANYTTFAITAGSLPPGLTFNATTGVISGIPTSPSNYSFTVTATGPYGSTSMTYSGSVSAPAPILPATLGGSFSVGSSSTAFVTGSNITSYSITAGSLPAGLVLNTLTGDITGSPLSVGAYSFTVTGVGPGGVSSKTYSGTVAPQQPVLPSTFVINPVLNQPFQTKFIGTGITRYSITAGTLPRSMTFNPVTGEIRGIPRVLGRFSFTITGTGPGGTTSRTYTGEVLEQTQPSKSTSSGSSSASSSDMNSSNGDLITSGHKVFFGLDSYWISGEEGAKLTDFVNAVKAKIAAGKHPLVKITGYVQPTRIEPFGPWLSQSRANAIAKFMRDSGLPGKYVVFGAGKASINKPSSRYVQIQATYRSRK